MNNSGNKVRMQDIAELANVSSMTVSKVLNAAPGARIKVSAAKIAEIRQLAVELGYRQNKLSLALSSKKTNMIGLMLPWNQPEVMDHIEHLVSASGYKLMLQFTAHPREGAELDALKSFLDWNVDGIIWEPSCVTHDDFLPELDRIQRKGPQLVMLQREIAGVKFPVVKSDYAPALKKCLKHLKEQRYTRIVFSSRKTSLELRDICLQIQSEAEQLNLKFQALELQVPADGKSYVEQYREILRMSDTPNTAFLCHCWFAVDMVKAMELEGLHAPQDIGIVMIQDLQLAGRLYVSSISRPEITAVRVNGTGLAEKAVNCLLAQIENKPFAPNSLSGKVDFIIQESTSRA